MSDGVFGAVSGATATGRAAECGQPADPVASATFADLLESECEAHCVFPPPGM